MRLSCALTGHPWEIVREEWLQTTRDRPYPLWVNYYHCPRCHDTKATQTSPKPSETFFSVPDKFCTDRTWEEAK